MDQAKIAAPKLIDASSAHKLAPAVTSELSAPILIDRRRSKVLLAGSFRRKLMNELDEWTSIEQTGLEWRQHLTPVASCVGEPKRFSSDTNAHSSGRSHVIAPSDLALHSVQINSNASARLCLGPNQFEFVARATFLMSLGIEFAN